MTLLMSASIKMIARHRSNHPAVIYFALQVLAACPRLLKQSKRTPNTAPHSPRVQRPSVDFSSLPLLSTSPADPLSLLDIAALRGRGVPSTAALVAFLQHRQERLRTAPYSDTALATKAANIPSYTTRARTLKQLARVLASLARLPAAITRCQWQLVDAPTSSTDDPDKLATVLVGQLAGITSVLSIRPRSSPPVAAAPFAQASWHPEQRVRRFSLIAYAFDAQSSVALQLPTDAASTALASALATEHRWPVGIREAARSAAATLRTLAETTAPLFSTHATTAAAAAPASAWLSESSSSSELQQEAKAELHRHKTSSLSNVRSAGSKHLHSSQSLPQLQRRGKQLPARQPLRPERSVAAKWDWSSGVGPPKRAKPNPGDNDEDNHSNDSSDDDDAFYLHPSLAYHLAQEQQQPVLEAAHRVQEPVLPTRHHRAVMGRTNSGASICIDECAFAHSTSSKPLASHQ